MQIVEKHERQADECRGDAYKNSIKTAWEQHESQMPGRRELREARKFGDKYAGMNIPFTSRALKVLASPKFSSGKMSYSDLYNMSMNFHILYKRLDQETAGNLGVLLNYALKQKYKKSKSLYRGTKTDELDSMSEYEMIGVGNKYFRYVCATTMMISAFRFGNVIIEYKKSSLPKEYVFLPAYSFGKEDYSRKGYMTEREQEVNLAYEAEVRIAPGVDINEIEMALHVMNTDPYCSKAKEFNSKYSHLGEIYYHKNTNITPHF